MDKHTMFMYQEAKVTMSVLSKLIFKVNAISIKIPSRYFWRHRQVYFNIYMERNRTES